MGHLGKTLHLAAFGADKPYLRLGEIVRVTVASFPHGDTLIIEVALHDVTLDLVAALPADQHVEPREDDT